MKNIKSYNENILKNYVCFLIEEDNKNYPDYSCFFIYELLDLTLYECQYKKRVKLETFQIQEIAKILMDIVHGLKYLFMKKIRYNDLTLSNVGIKQGKCKLIDFIPEKFFFEKDKTVGFRLLGNPVYVAPEILSGNSKIILWEKAALWSLGMILYELIYFKRPFDILKITKLKNQNIEFPLGFVLPESWKDLLLDVLLHPFSI